MTLDEKCPCGFPRLPERHALAHNRENPEMILPVVPCSLRANWRLMEEMDHIDRLESSDGTVQPRGHIWTGRETDSFPRTACVIHLWGTPDSIQGRKVRGTPCSCSVFRQTTRQLWLQRGHRGNWTNCRLPAVLRITALTTQDCSLLQAWQQALWGHDDTPPTSKLKPQCFH